MQYTKRDWRNRNLIKTGTGLKWLTIPSAVKGKYEQKINETYIADVNWRQKHVAILKQNYSKAACYKSMLGLVEDMYATADFTNLSSINIHLLKRICTFLNIKTKFINSNELELSGNRSEKLANICTGLGATTYITGPASKEYIEEEIFIAKNIKIEYADYSNYPEYPQLYPPFEHGLSIIDLIFNCGNNAIDYMKFTNK
jgi:hypothetical protein